MSIEVELIKDTVNTISKWHPKIKNPRKYQPARIYLDGKPISTARGQTVWRSVKSAEGTLYGILKMAAARQIVVQYSPVFGYTYKGQYFTPKQYDELSEKCANELKKRCKVVPCSYEEYHQYV